MLKAVGAVMILTGCIGTGLWYRSRFLGRIRALRQLAAILELLCSEIRYGRETLWTCGIETAGGVPRRVSEDCGKNA